MSARVSPDPQLSAAAPGGFRRALFVALVAALHAAAFGILLWSETDAVGRAAFVLAWLLVNGVLLLVLRRPAPAAALSLLLVTLIVLLSRFKHDVLLMTVNFLDVMIVDADTIAFLLTVFPNLRATVAVFAALLVPTIALLWWFDPLRVRGLVAAAAALLSLAGLSALALAVPNDLYEEFSNAAYVSKFARSGVTGVVDLATRGYLESAAHAEPPLAPAEPCRPAAKLPHIVLLFDESSFDISRIAGVKTPAGYQEHFRSFDGRSRALLVEGAGGPSWYTEYNVLTGLSVRSYGRFADFVTRIAAGRVERGLPRALTRCGYRTFSLYPMWGAFAGARTFQETTGIEHFRDATDLGTREIEPDSFYHDAAVALMVRERGQRPLFVFSYTALNHFPWTFRFHPERTPEWRETGNAFEVDEYLRRQEMSRRDYADFIARLRRELPDEPILIVRFGDHQPSFAKHLVDPALDDSVLARRIAEADPRFLTTYYAIDRLNMQPADLGAALDTLDAPFLPLVVLEAAGVPLDPSFAEQKRILQRCNGLFYACGKGAEASRFNRLLIDAGLIKGLVSR